MWFNRKDKLYDTHLMLKKNEFIRMMSNTFQEIGKSFERETCLDTCYKSLTLLQISMVVEVESPSNSGPDCKKQPISLSKLSANRKCVSDTVAVCSCCGSEEEVTWQCVRDLVHRQLVCCCSALSVPEDWLLQYLSFYNLVFSFSLIIW